MVNRTNLPFSGNMSFKLKIGIDTGGTFTDLVAFDEETKKTIIIKLPSSPDDPSEAVIEVIKCLRKKSKKELSLIVHASTLGTNLFLGQIGLNIPKGALVTTSGFRDVLEIGRQRRAELYNPFFERKKPLIERNLRFTVNERVNFNGKVLKSIDEKEVINLSRKIREEGVETIAISFIHSYVNSENEVQVKEILKKELPDKVIVSSHEVDPEYREYERTSTTVINSLLVPVVSRYLEMIKKRLKKLGVDVPIYMMQSNGGLATVDEASKIPVTTIESGPATGVTASAYWAKMIGVENILSFDMGGTTAKAGAVINGVPQMVSEYEVGGKVHSGRIVKGSGYSVRSPFIDLAEVSGGGGTIAWVDQGDFLRVGPLSAGADPGPACYGRWGANPTVTDANLILGRLGKKGLSGGEIELFKELAENSLKEKIAEPLGLSLVEAANGIIEVVNNHMTRALRLVSIERGHDPRDFSMLAFGGAGPMHAPFLADELAIKKIFIPPSPGVFSALGLLLSDFRHDLMRSVMKEASKINRSTLKEIFEKLESEAFRILKKEGFRSDRIILERKLSLRYLGQSYELLVSASKNLEGTFDLFHIRHQETYGYAERSEPVEVVNAHLVAIGQIKKPELKKEVLRSTSPSSKALIEKRSVYFDDTGWKKTPVFSRHFLYSGNQINGPAILE